MSYYDPIVYRVGDAEDGWLLRDVLRRRMRLSRRLVTRMKHTEHGIELNGVRVHVGVRVQSGDVVTVRMEEESSDDILPQPMPLDILHEDEHLLVIDKPPGIVVHPTKGHYTGTLANAVVHYWMRKGERRRFRPVHRLDQDTSGVLVIAKNPLAHQRIAEQMNRRQVDKTYLALVAGKVHPSSGTIAMPIARSEEDPRLRTVVPTGEPAVTHYETVTVFSSATMVRLQLETGKTHQIRVHMRHIGHPLLGDPMYGPECGRREWAVVSRLALHASSISFRHPHSGDIVTFRSPIPSDFRSWIRKLSEYGSEQEETP